MGVEFLTEFKTQKARGVDALRKGIINSFAPFKVQNVAIARNEHLRAIAKGRYSAAWDDGAFAAISMQEHVFARPCPITPRHGFVESRLVRSGKELVGLAKETLRTDKQAEMIFAPYIDAAANAIVTRAGVVIGPSNDGATAGKGAFTIPVPSAIKDEYLPDGVIKESPYIEVVIDKEGRAYAVQMRDGPEPPATNDWVSNTIKVQHVYKVNGDEDLLAFEKKAKKFPKGTVVYHPGGAITSHVGVHCVLNSIPYVTRPVQVGDVLEPTTSYEWGKEEYNALAGLARTAAITEPPPINDPGFFDHLSRETLAAFGVIHGAASAVTTEPNHQTMSAIAYAMMHIIRVAAMSSLGEVRFASKRLLRYEYDPRIEQYIFDTLSMEPSRAAVYKDAYNWELERLAVGLYTAMKIFAEPIWGGGFGGKRWRISTKRALMTAYQWHKFMNTGRKLHFDAAVKHAHQLLNETHNGGKYLNKVLNTSQLDRLADNPGMFTLFGFNLIQLLNEGGYEPTDDLIIFETPKDIAKVEAELVKKTIESIVHEIKGE